MKKITLLFICFLVFQANAQVTVKPGVRAGLNLANLTNTNFDTKADFYIGGFVAIKLANFYTLQPELTYTRQGAKGNNEYADIEPFAPLSAQNKDYSLQYISMGVMNKFTFAQSFHALIGPSVDIKVDDNFTGYEREDLIGLDLAINGGIGYTLPIGLTIEARYKLGLLDIFGDDYDLDNDNDYDYDNIKLNSVIQLGIAYTF